MATIIKIQWTGDPKNQVEQYTQGRLLYWAVDNKFLPFVSADKSIIITDIHEKTAEFQQLIEILKFGNAKFLAIGNVDLNALYESCRAEISKQNNI